MKAVCFSDTHHNPLKLELPEADFGFFAGDCCGRGDEKQYRQFIDWYAEQPVKYKIFVPGNHDKFTEKRPDHAISIAKAHGIHVLINDFIVIDGIKIYGTPIQPFFMDWAWNVVKQEDRAKVYSQIPPDVDVLITHCPPYGVLDNTPPTAWNNYSTEEHVGCYALLEQVMKVKPKYHVFGHIHHSHGALVRHGTKFINASICTEKYHLTNPFIVIDLDEDFSPVGFEGIP